LSVARRSRKTYEHTVSEKAFQAHVIQCARINGFRVGREDPLSPHLDLIMHIHDSRKSAGVGFPDLVLAHPKRPVLYLVELKTERGRIRPEQKIWKGVLERIEAASCGVVRYRLWRPSMWESIVEELGGADAKLFV
jgi:hypothetical protein